jgi:glycosyltransferase involved in cell wall biosynthesis
MPKPLANPPVLLSLPQGVNVSGITLWATRLANALASHDHPVTLLTHPEPPHQKRLDIPLDARINRIHIDAPAPLDQCNGDLSFYLPHYTRALTELAAQSTLPVVFLPNLAGDCFGIAAALSLTFPDQLRTIGWMHNDTEYDACVLHHYQPLLHRFVPVSQHIRTTLHDRIPTRAADITRIPYGIEIPPTLPTRQPLANRPLRVLYTGRIDHYQKRIGIVPEISAALDALDVPHTLTMLGDGPASDEIDARCAQLPNCSRTPAVSPAKVRQALSSHDCFVLTSRFEGLSISMLEALAHGCAPIVASVASGASEAILHNTTGIIIDAGEDDESSIAGLFAQHIGSLAADESRLHQLQTGAHHHATAHYSLSAHIQSVRTILHEVAREAPRVWPTDRPCAFTSDASILGDATVPADAPRRMRDTLRQIAAQTPHARVALWGAGRHTIALAAEFAKPPVPIVAVLDDDASHHSDSIWGLPIIDPAAAHEHEITDVIISSWMHQPAMWNRRAQIESQGIRVHRIYPSVDGASLRQKPAHLSATITL